MTLRELLKELHPQYKDCDIEQYSLVTEEYNDAQEKWQTIDIDEIQINHDTKQIFLK